MSDGITVDLIVNKHLLDAFRIGLSEKLENPGDEAMYKIYQLLKEKFEPYVPIDVSIDEESEEMDSDGAEEVGETAPHLHMVDRVEVTADGLTYPGPYAHYMYMGEVYGPNIPTFDATGKVIKWRSPKGKKKTPTGRLISYSNAPSATSFWDKAALLEHREEIELAIRDIIIEAWKNERG